MVWLWLSFSNTGNIFILLFCSNLTGNVGNFFKTVNLLLNNIWSEKILKLAFRKKSLFYLPY